ncbi:MAG: hypothetical protein PHW66_09590 [Gallionella sp.]|nr:hypothetical protein [Gallionella sp.]
MTAPTNLSNVNCGPVQRTQGSISGTYTAATDVSTTTNASIAAGVMTLTLGFVPTRFMIMNVTDRVKQEWFKGMNSGDYLETAADGTVTLETDDKVVVAIRTGAGGSASQSGGSADTSASGVVTVTFDSGIATDNDTVVWVAEG